MYLAATTKCLFLKQFQLASLLLLTAKLHSRYVESGAGVENFGS